MLSELPFDALVERLVGSIFSSTFDLVVTQLSTPDFTVRQVADAMTNILSRNFINRDEHRLLETDSAAGLLERFPGRVKFGDELFCIERQDLDSC